MARPGQVGQTRTAGLDIDRPGLRAVTHGGIALSLKPGGFTAAEYAAKINELTGDELGYTTRQSAYDPKKLRGKALVAKTHPNARRYQATPDGLRTMSRLIVLRQKVIEPRRTACWSPSEGRCGHIPVCRQTGGRSPRCATC